MIKTTPVRNYAYALLLGSILAFSVFSSATVVKVDQLQSYRQTVNPEAVDNYMFASYFTNAKKAYNLRGFEIASPGKNIRDIKINPAGYSFALLYGKPGKTAVKIKSLNPLRKIDTDIKGLVSPVAICYLPDSRQLAVVDDGKIKFIDSKTFVIEREVPLAGDVTSLVISPDGYIGVALSPNNAQIVSLSDGRVRKSLNLSANGSAAFNKSGSQLGILTEDGILTLYNTSDLSVANTLENLGIARSLFFHPDENYVGMVCDNKYIQFVNLFDSTDKPVIFENDLASARFVSDGFNNLYLASFGKNSIKYRQIEGFLPNYSLLINDMVEERMREWSKMRPGETEIEYRERVNEESMRRQRMLFANEAASELALTAGLGTFSDVTLGRYNPQDGTLVISLGGLNDIYLTVPPDDMTDFGDGNNLQFSDHVFTVNPDNTFELIYVQVYNPTNGKTYVFDNLDRQNLSFLAMDNDFVSLDLIMQSSREDIMLKDIKDQVIEEARSNKILSDHTTINVDTHIEASTDESGRPVKNYHVDFTYQVDVLGSATEDFAPGKYKIEQSPAALSMARIIQQAFTNEFASYLVPGKTLMIEVTGAADALQIRGMIAYDGSLGEFEDEPCYVDGNLTALTVKSDEGIRTNEQLAFMRAQAIRQNLMHDLPQIEKMNVHYKDKIEVSKEKGAEHRRVKVALIFVDAF